jgi:transposase InsO family protein
MGCSASSSARFYTNKMPVTAVHLLNTDVLPTFEAHGIAVKTVLSDTGREFCGRLDCHLQLEGIEHRTTRVKRPQSNGIVERF